MLYVPPAIIQDILGGLPLPFIAGGITRDPVLASAAARLLRHVHSELENFKEDDALFDLAQAMRRHAGHREQRKCLDYPAVQRARAYLDSATRQRVSLADLEAISGQTRWRLSRDFRGLFGTSPYRYLTMRRLDDAKYQLRTGMTIAEAAITAGFADQSHLTRQFADAFGITPGPWAALAKTRDRN